MSAGVNYNLFSNVDAPAPSLCVANPFVSRSTFYQGDCLVEMDKIADKSIDMILCDLPYGTTACKWDAVIPFEPLWKHYERIIKDNGVIVLTASQPFTTDLICSNRKIFKYEWIWEKTQASGIGICNTQPMKEHENVLIFYKKTPTYNKQLEPRKCNRDTIKRLNYKMSGLYKGNHIKSKRIKKMYNPNISNPKTVIQFDSVYNFKGNKIHPTQKPVELMEYLIKTYTNEGETVLDNCMGSGTTGVACKKTGRHFIGIEKDEKYFEIAVKRIENELNYYSQK